MATRDEVMATAERLIRRGELGDAIGLLEMWVRGNPADTAAASRLTSVRALADPSELKRAAVRAAAASSAPRPSVPQPKPLPADPVELLNELLARVEANKRK